MEILSVSFIYFYLIKKCFTYIVFPLKVIGEENKKIDNLFSFNTTYTIIEMGNPPQKINYYFSFKHNKMNVTDIGCVNMNLFDISYSSTFLTLGYPDEDEDYSSKVFAYDSLYFYDNINLSNIIKMDKLPLYYTADLNKEENYLCGSIGLSIVKYDEESDEIEYYLKYMRSHNKYFSFFNYKNQDFIVNNIFLHEEFKDIFQDIKNITWLNPLIKDNSFYWEISMKEIYYKNKFYKNRVVCELNPLFELIIGTNDYKLNIKKDFFSFYIYKNICLINKIKEYQIFECDESKFTLEDIKNFPSLYMFNANIEYEFEMIGEELFYKLNNKYYFIIVFPEKDLESNKWVIGKMFLRKYPVIFSPLNRLVGFYLKDNDFHVPYREEKEKENKEKVEEQLTKYKKIYTKNIYLYIEIIVISFIFICLGLYFGRKIYFNRKRKINELIDDNYRYVSETSKDNEYEKKYKKNDFNSIEMSCKLEEK